jgi:hypothetical protein
MPASVVLDVVAKVGRDVTITDAIVGGSLERTIDGASTLTIDVHDPHRRLIRSPDLKRAIDFHYEGTWFRLVKIAKSGNTVSLTFEDRDVAYLRRHTKPRAMSRGKVTRAQFVRTLVREVKENRIDFYCPELNQRQAIAKEKTKLTPRKVTKKEREHTRGKGINSDANLTVKGRAATPEQVRNMQRVLDVADTLGANAKATKALIEAVIVESQVQNLSGGDRDSIGILQVRVSTSGSAAKSRDIEWCVKQFLTKGFYTDPELGGGGAMAIAQRHPKASAGRVAQATQGSGVPYAYDTWSKEAQEWLEAYHGGGTKTTTTTTTTTGGNRMKYEFSRGLAGKREDSWATIMRLAEEVNWRAFMDAGTLYFVSEDRLIKSAAKYIMSEDTDGVNTIDFDVDQGKVSSEVNVSCRTDLFDIRVGSVVAIRDMGIANGRWLVTTVRQDLFGADTDVTLRAATPKLAEPDAERSQESSDTDTSTTDDTDDGSGGSKVKTKLASDTTVMKCWRKANAIDKKHYPYTWGGGHGSFDGPYDCSGFVSAVLHAGGLLLSAPMATPGLINWGQLGEGKYMTVWVKENGNARQSHTFMTFTLEGAGKGKEQFAEAGGAESNDTGWHKSRNKAGFVPRHWPGT